VIIQADGDSTAELSPEVIQQLIRQSDHPNSTHGSSDENANDGFISEIKKTKKVVDSDGKVLREGDEEVMEHSSNRAVTKLKISKAKKSHQETSHFQNTTDGAVTEWKTKNDDEEKEDLNMVDVKESSQAKETNKPQEQEAEKAKHSSSSDESLLKGSSSSDSSKEKEPSSSSSAGGSSDDDEKSQNDNNSKP